MVENLVGKEEYCCFLALPPPPPPPYFQETSFLSTLLKFWFVQQRNNRNPAWLISLSRPCDVQVYNVSVLVMCSDSLLLRDNCRMHGLTCTRFFLFHPAFRHGRL